MSIVTAYTPIPERSRRKRLAVSAVCASCGVDFRPFTEKSAYCSQACYHAAIQRPETGCPTCGALFRPTRHRKGFCSRACVVVALRRGGAISSTRRPPNYKGRWINRAGYVMVHVKELSPQDLRLADASRARPDYVREHRLVMARALGRRLLATEQVHHRNGNKSDNRPENLELRVGNHGTGASASALTCPHCGLSYDSDGDA